jgi:hypothetical protein
MTTQKIKTKKVKSRLTQKGFDFHKEADRSRFIAILKKSMSPQGLEYMDKLAQELFDHDSVEVAGWDATNRGWQLLAYALAFRVGELSDGIDKFVQAGTESIMKINEGWADEDYD